MIKNHLCFLGALFLFASAQAFCGETAAGAGEKKDAAPSAQSADNKKKENKETANAKTDNKQTETAKKESDKTKNENTESAQAKPPVLTIGSNDSLVVPAPSDSDIIALVCQDGDDLVLYSALDDGEQPHYAESAGALVFPDGEVVEVVDDSLCVRSYSFGPFSVDVDHDDKKGFFAYIEAGYQWTFLRKTGFEVAGNRTRRNISMSGPAASIGFGYNFGPDVPLALEMSIGVGPDIHFSNRRTFGNTFIDSKQKLSLYNLDASINYDIKTKSCWTPFVGITTGFTLVTERGRLSMTPAGGPTAYGEFKRKHRVNLMGGLRAGTKIKIHEKVTLSAFAAYNYMGDIPAQYFSLSDGTEAKTNRVKAHELSAKLSLKVDF